MKCRLFLATVFVPMVIAGSAWSAEPKGASAEFVIEREAKLLEKEPGNINALMGLADAYTLRLEIFVADINAKRKERGLPWDQKELTEILSQLNRYTKDILSTYDQALQYAPNSQEVLVQCLEGKMRIVKMMEKKKEEAPAPAAEQAAPAAPAETAAETRDTTQPSAVEPAPISEEDKRSKEVEEQVEATFDKLTEGVVALLDRLADINKADWNLYVRKGLFLVEYAGRYDEALESYRKAESLAPQNKEVLVKIAECFEAKGELSEAERYYTKAITIAGATKDLLMKRIEVWDRLYISKEYKEYQERKEILYKKIDDCSIILKANPKDDFGLRTRMSAITTLISTDSFESFLNKGKDDKILKMVRIGIQDASVCISKNKKDDAMYIQRAIFYEYLGDLAKAISDCSQALSIDPKNSFTYSRRHSLYKELNQDKKALADIENAIRYADKEFATIYRSEKADLQYGQGKLELSRLEFGRLCRENPGLYSNPCYKEKEISKEMRRGNKWVEYAGSNKTTYFYDKTGVPASRKKVFKVWIRDEQNESSKEGDLEYSLASMQIDCGKREIGSVMSIEYDSNGNSLNTYTASKVAMQPVIPDSVGEALLKKLCK